MLNCCIRHKTSHQQLLHTPNTHSKNSNLHTSETHSKSDTNTSSLDFKTPNTSIHQTPAKSESHDIKEDSQDDGSDSDEFFEAMETHDGAVTMATDDTTPMETQKIEDLIDPLDDCSHGDGGSHSDTERVGALKPCGDLVLVATGEPLYIPVTQVG